MRQGGSKSEDTKIVVSRTIPAPAKDIFNLLTLPARHQEFDGSDMVRADEKSQRIQKVGDVFCMNMHADSMGGDYKMYNHVVAYAENKIVGWQPANEDDEDNPKGWQWTYELEPEGADSTIVTLTYDWSKVTDKELLSIFPAVSEE